MKGVDYNKKAFSKIASIESKEVELKSEKVELGLVEDISKLSEQSKKLEGEVVSASKDMDVITDRKKSIEKEYADLTKKEDKARDKFFAQQKKIDPVLTKIKEALSKAERASSDLGIKPTAIDGYKELQQDYNRLAKLS